MARIGDPLFDEIESHLATGAGDRDLQAVLEKVIDAFGCATGTIHSLDQASGVLRLRAQRGIPEALMDRVSAIPVGKGMAGLAAERREPVQVCNLQADDSGVAKPGAKLTQMEGSIAAPMLDGGKLRGTIGVAKPTTYEFTSEESSRLLRIGELIAARL
jgi:signal transduction protein with GAF and PtsI domain